MTTEPFDICDGRNRYLPCPGCGRDSGMGLTSRGGAAFVWCPHCGTEGPHVAFSVPGPETDRKAFDGWNGMDRMARL
jgi:sarcosine oxidase delta subunit